jgi:FkbH-like protein
MELTIRPFDETGRKRITQLIAKSNQFNLTTKRYSESMVAALETDVNSIALQARLKDVFGDNGMISAVVATREGDRAIIDLWIMSCRVIGRKVELGLLSALVSKAKEWGCSEIVGVYRPTSRNALVKDHYATLGFKKCSEGSDETLWSLHTEAFIAPSMPFSSLHVE